MRPTWAWKRLRELEDSGPPRLNPDCALYVGAEEATAYIRRGYYEALARARDEVHREIRAGVHCDPSCKFHHPGACPRCGGELLDLRQAGFNPDALREQQTCYLWGESTYTCNQ